MKTGFILRQLMILLMLAFPLVQLCSCAQKKQEDVRIGIILPLTGIHAVFGDIQKKGYDLALEEINSSSTGGKKITFLMEDDGSDERKAIGAVQKLILQEKVNAIVGSYSSATTFNAIEVANHYKVPIITPSAAADLITQKKLPWVFRVNAPSSIYAETMLNYTGSLKKVKTLAVLYENSLFGTTVSEALENQAKEHNINLVFSASYDPKEPAYIPVLLSQVKKRKPDGIIMISYLDDAVEIMKHMKAQGINEQLYFGAGGGFTLYEFIRKAGSTSDLVFNVSQWSPEIPWPRSREFVRRFKARYHEEPTFHSVEAYVGAIVMAEAVKQAVRPDQEGIRKSLLELDMDTAYSHVKFENFGDFTNQNRHTMVVQQIQKGRFVLIWPDDYRTGTPVFPAPAWNKRTGN